MADGTLQSAHDPGVDAPGATLPGVLPRHLGKCSWLSGLTVRHRPGSTGTTASERTIEFAARGLSNPILLRSIEFIEGYTYDVFYINQNVVNLLLLQL